MSWVFSGCSGFANKDTLYLHSSQRNCSFFFKTSVQIPIKIFLRIKFKIPIITHFKLSLQHLLLIISPLPQMPPPQFSLAIGVSLLFLKNVTCRAYTRLHSFHLIHFSPRDSHCPSIIMSLIKRHFFRKAFSSQAI